MGEIRAEVANPLVALLHGRREIPNVGGLQSRRGARRDCRGNG
jgi:hypothetical protein